MSKATQKELYDRALKEAIKANNAKNKIVINKLRVKCEKIRVQKYSSIRVAKLAKQNKVNAAKILVTMKLDGELNLSLQQIADRCFVSLQHIRNTSYTIRKERKNDNGNDT